MTIEPTDGEADEITTSTESAGNDIVLGGAAGDVIQTNGGDDIVLGDHGQLDYAIDLNTTTLDLIAIKSIDLEIGAADTIYAGAGDDVVIGGFGDDRLDGGADSDLILGDAVTLELQLQIVADTPNITSERFQALLGQTLYSRTEMPEELQGAAVPTSGNESGKVLVDGTPLDYRIPGTDAPFWAEYEITELYHSAAIEAGDVEDLDKSYNDEYIIADLDESYGNDYIAGGAGHDMIFGQLGDDVIQGDGSIDEARPGRHRGRQLRHVLAGNVRPQAGWRRHPVRGLGHRDRSQRVAR